MPTISESEAMFLLILNFRRNLAGQDLNVPQKDFAISVQTFVITHPKVYWLDSPRFYNNAHRSDINLEGRNIYSLTMLGGSNKII
jgi:hypothetical protein